MGGKVVKNFEGYGVLIKARTKFVHSGLYIFTDWEVWAEWWLVPMRYPNQCFGGERRRNMNDKFQFQSRLKSTCFTQ